MVKNKKKIAVLRTLGVRITQAEFARSFKKFEPTLMGDLNKEVKSYSKKNGLKYIDIPLKNAYLFDPVKLFLGRRSHQSLVGPDKNILEKELLDKDVFEIYETYFFYSRYTAEIARKQNKPLVTEIWTSFPEHPARFIFPYSKNVNTVINNSDLFILRSGRALNYLEPFKVPARKKIVLYHGVNLKRFYPPKVSDGAKVRILFVGTLAEHKGLPELLSVFESIYRQRKDVELLISGSGVLEERVRAMATKLPIKYFGEVPHTKIQDIYRKADIFCGPSKSYSFIGIKRWEEFVGYTFMEAMATGLPIVTTDSGGIPEIVGKDNFIAPQGDSRKLYEYLNELIESKKLRKSISAKNRVRAIEFFDLEKQAAKTENVIIEKLSGRI